MNFFSQLSEILTDDVPFKIVATKSKGQLTMSIVPDVSDTNLLPLSASGSPEEMDQQFFAVLSEPVRQSGLIAQTKVTKTEKKTTEKAKEEKKEKKEEKPVAQAPSLFDDDKVDKAKVEEKPVEEPVKEPVEEPVVDNGAKVVEENINAITEAVPDDQFPMAEGSVMQAPEKVVEEPVVDPPPFEADNAEQVQDAGFANTDQEKKEDWGEFN